jgi:hypothetical protein
MYLCSVAIFQRNILYLITRVEETGWWRWWWWRQNVPLKTGNFLPEFIVSQFIRQIQNSSEPLSEEPLISVELDLEPQDVWRIIFSSISRLLC